MTIERKRPLLGDVLIVDDDPAVCEILEEYCKKMNCFRNILLAHDGSMASSKLRNQTFTLILLDLNLPKKGGLDLIREFCEKSSNSKNKIVIVSGVLDKDILEKILSFGIKNFLLKPFDEAGFQEKILKILTTK